MKKEDIGSISLAMTESNNGYSMSWKREVKLNEKQIQAIREATKKAADIADKAFTLKKHGETGKAKQLFTQGFYLAKKVAFVIPNNEEYEPSRSNLFSNAAALAFNAGLFREAEIMAAHGLTGSPTDEIANELRGFILNTVPDYFDESVEDADIDISQHDYVRYKINGKTVRLFGKQEGKYMIGLEANATILVPREEIELLKLDNSE